ncbi:MAG: DUF3417 domain-containing protein, partial [Ilumatobacteraceae bacterium]
MTPDQLRDALRRLARNLRWTWNHRAAGLLAELPGADPGRHPLGVIADLDDGQLAALADDEVLVGAVVDAVTDLDAEMATAVEAPDVVYFSPEFGVSEAVPQYSGGLGVLAGDHLKAASDLGVSLGAVGLFYREGFFRQSLSAGEQAERIETHAPEALGCTDTGVAVDIPMAGRTVVAKVWRVDVGRVPMLLLDTDVVANA